MPEFRRGPAAIAEAAAPKGGGGGFRGFCPEIFWKEDGEKKYVLVLSPIDEVLRLNLHEMVKLERTKTNGDTYYSYESFASRKDDVIGEDYDKIEDEFGRKPRTRILGVAVELEPVMEVVKGRKRPTGFAVKTDEFTRNTDDGEETVTYPLLGIISQSSKLMWQPLQGHDEGAYGPLENLPLEITRHIPNGKAADTFYNIVPFGDVPVDLSAVVDHLDGISYFGEEDLTELIAELESLDGEEEIKQAQAVAHALLEKRALELIDGERYEALLGDVDELEPQPWEKGKAKAAKSAPKKRPARPSQRTAKEDDSEEDNAPEETTPEEPESKQDRFAKLKASLGDK